jgi:hypothetical protein
VQHFCLGSCHHNGKLAVVLAPVFCLIGLGGLPSAAAASAIASATVIAPVNVMTSWLDLPVTVSQSGIWVTVAVPPARIFPLVSDFPPLLSEPDLSVGVLSSDSGTLAHDGAVFDRRSAALGALHGEFITFLSAPMPLGGGRYSITVAFN